ncbi:MAG TPA: hypothetical protein VK674_04240 [Candidatus Limnocylindria bacterium]|nr:hypothetical protein [Candidatus Limnocylindria bacterium]
MSAESGLVHTLRECYGEYLTDPVARDREVWLTATVLPILDKRLATPTEQDRVVSGLNYVESVQRAVRHRVEASAEEPKVPAVVDDWSARWTGADFVHEELGCRAMTYGAICHAAGVEDIRIGAEFSGAAFVLGCGYMLDENDAATLPEVAAVVAMDARYAVSAQLVREAFNVQNDL